MRSDVYQAKMLVLTTTANVEKDTAAFLTQPEQVVIYRVARYSEPIRGIQ